MSTANDDVDTLCSFFDTFPEDSELFVPSATDRYAADFQTY